LSKVNFKSYLAVTPHEHLPSDLEIIVATYGRPYLSLSETAECIGMSYQSIYALVRAGAIRSSRDGRRGSYRISAVEIARYMNSHQI
jgi:excisionase family DNA binding protein